MNKLIEIALGEYGVQEIIGSKHSERVLQYFKEIGHGWVHDDETAWCSAFVNWVCLKAGYERSEKLNARSWLDVGVEIIRKVTIDLTTLYPIKEINKELGDIVVLWRNKKDSDYGHVGFYIKEDEDYVWILGGNQNNQVSIEKYPKSRVLGYRRLKPIKE